MGRAVLAIFVGLAVLVVSVGAAFTLKILFRPPPGRDDGVIDLEPWLQLELIVGGLAAVLAGYVCARIARGRVAPLVLAGLVGGLGLLEMLEILIAPMIESIELHAPLWMVLSAPVVGAGGVLCGAGVHACTSRNP